MPKLPASPLRPPALVVRAPELRGQYLAPLLLLRADEARYLASTPMRRQFLGISAIYETFVGRYARAHELMDRLRAAPPGAYAERGLPAGAVAHPAHDAVLREARGRRALFINETHHAPQHRAFTLELLTALRSQGFNVFAAEMISTDDTALVRRRYPAAGRTGIYTDEPLGGSMVREAMRLGFRVVAYDTLFACDDPDDDPLFCANERERRQAEALAAVLRDDPAARLVVHAGPGHVFEEAQGEWVPMAARFRERSGVDPLTVDQTEMTEHSAPRYEHPAFRDADRRGLLRAPVLLEERGRWVVRDAPVDLQVFHPRTRLVRGRPQWLPAGRHRVHAGFGPFPRAVLLQAFAAAEGPDAVPVDQVLVEARRQAPPLVLPPGEFRVVALGEAGPAAERRIRVEARGRVR